ncbi:hypothetical protein CC85DRAFT_296511 [Cutaneotrichosporon oleaginosum]|uniref:GPR1/FUN34/yaaH family-domain-containing protein n=1 Tax=Cutaneotrichosporon oleaginosum TaxID=879819 RepID=A0A0J0XNB2_9TREE|nr:uncharacterized protein CC85DRAFT_296511 [Cutaneotrichosporon oleaginosum]KLT42568.1 hypothetical protein CC85DRAFT_296511 [Cutaneotrichosporon oleaginosum]TXT15016.1 hypothetical protein COLE_01209 [Cutaneotrichosporon oleaginosum]
MSAPTGSDSSTNLGYLGAGDLEKGRGAHIERMITPGGHPIDYSQPAIPVQHRKFGNPIPVGLISFSMAFMMVGLISVGVRGIKAPNGVLSSLMFFVGITQTLVGWFEMFIGNTFSATIFCAFGGFCFSYVGFFLPAMGIVDAFTDKATGEISPDLANSLGLFLAIWSGICLLFLLAALRSSVAIIAVLFFTMLAFAMLAASQFTGSVGVTKAAGAICIMDACCGFWAAMAGYWTPDTTYAFIRVDPIDLSPRD